MAGHARYMAVLDACVLYPVAVADTLMSLAAVGVFAAKWTTLIESEWIRSLETDRPDLVGRLEYRRDQMPRAALDCEVPEAAWRPLTDGLTLPDPNDIHVLAAAIAGHADGIVTTNLVDFPLAILAQHGLERIHPDEFIVAQIDLDLVSSLSAFRSMRGRRQNPQNSPLEFAAALERNGLALTAERLRECVELI
jgi:predicted nucleic acid-binding protein